MREFHSRHALDGDHGRADGIPRPDAPHRHAPDSPADHPAAHARDRPKYAILSDPAERVAAHLAYRKTVEAHQAADYAARHAKPQDTRPDHAPDSMDKPSSRIAARDLPEHEEVSGNRKRERPRLSVEHVAIAMGADNLYNAVNAVYHIGSAKPDGIVAAALGLLLAGTAWANKRWKDKHGDRPED